MGKDLKKLLNELKGRKKTDRKRVNLYLSESLLKEFQALCGTVAVSRVVEAWMREMVEESRRKT